MICEPVSPALSDMREPLVAKSTGVIDGFAETHTPHVCPPGSLPIFVFLLQLGASDSRQGDCSRRLDAQYFWQCTSVILSQSRTCE